MPFEKGQSGNPKGRPKGTKNRFGPELLEKNQTKLLRKLVDKALAGDTTSLQVCIDRLLPKLKPIDRSIEVRLCRTLSDQGREVLEAACMGLITPDEAYRMLASLLTQANLIETDELIHRVEALEERENNSQTLRRIPLLEN